MQKDLISVDHTSGLFVPSSTLEDLQRQFLSGSERRFVFLLERDLSDVVVFVSRLLFAVAAAAMQ